MKSAYEKAMEKLEAASGPGKTLNDAQKARLAEIDSQCDAKIAQARMQGDEEQTKATTNEDFQNVRSELAAELQRIEEQREREKDAVWNE